MNMNKIKSAVSFLFVPLFAFGAIATAHAGTITVSNFSTPARTAVILNAAEKQVLTDKTGTISAVCGEHKIGIPPFFNFEQDNNFLLTSCEKGLVVKVTNAGYKSSKYNNAFKMKQIPAGAREPSTVTVSDFSSPARTASVVNQMQKVVLGNNGVGKVIVSLGSDEKSMENRMEGVKTSN
ncbi:hypothetical protein [Acidithiobacillus thiooxidans]|uniref:hypothetical protein n=1 Tax=Acidithiobacillus thiooxidans TaxID=930 RepID=UPI001C06BDE7|nr:hypothetical protein [Acidithiobacillus thiooxidans]MBU2843557.1 hypothetical protein [Acidithiobacillus thiooxidans]